MAAAVLQLNSHIFQGNLSALRPPDVIGHRARTLIGLCDAESTESAAVRGSAPVIVSQSQTTAIAAAIAATMITASTRLLVFPVSALRPQFPIPPIEQRSATLLKPEQQGLEMWLSFSLVFSCQRM
ncbi:hypothetical protein [Rhodococcus sp. IEGM 1307]|uniref:hypothetical protein n=1 Tax=Rhodococcus sp. IEGM 1307 TaxID=3047091 RepID=UPI0024B7C800|nr:hypothetical protein [Rhodococcus sp. IEGM 1307]MDI9980035.1 hypothetical protein [Rhodococcus sp. IEGM 1307]